MSKVSSEKNRKLRVWKPVGEAGEASFGTWLRRQREVREISLREIADATKISLRYLEAFEKDEFEALPAPVFARGFLRQYARYVGLDPDEAVNSYLNAQLADQEEENGEEPQSGGRRAGRRVWPLVVLLLLLVLGIAGYFLLRWRSDGRTLPLPAPPPATVVAPALSGGAESNAGEGVTLEPSAAGVARRPEGSIADGTAAGGSEPTATAAVPKASTAGREVAAPAADSAPLVVTLDFLEDCWVEAQVDGRRYISELHVQGEALRIEAQQSVRLMTLGNVRGVRAEVNGRPFPLPASEGDASVARDVVIDLRTLAAGQESNE